MQNKQKISMTQQLFINDAFLFKSCCTLLIISFLASTWFVTSALEVTGGQQGISLGSSESTIKGLLADANHTLKSGDVTKTIQDLFNLQRIIGQISDNSSSIQSSKLLIRDTLQALVNNKVDTASTNLNLIYQQLIIGIASNETLSTITALENETTLFGRASSGNESNETSSIVDNRTSLNYRYYDNHVYGIKILYPNNWTVRSYNYNNAGNNTLVGFFSPSKTASQLGNISGVSGQFVPYLDIYVFDSKNMSLDSIIKGRVDRIQNYTYSQIDESKPFVLKGNLNAHMLVYSTSPRGNELFKKIQVYTLFDAKVYLITFTSQEALFSNYLRVIQKIINSFEIQNSFN
ncbi:MAG TPA: PsbP-related protein [Nitrososphaeraceae archaeon]|nr:PsbP-related protein [Nitrososphaeraceae archaeon]